ncbi:MAG: NAD(P)-dependent oxidoreductase [Rhodospirillaceae bacterium]|nr:NAD(P)-dependent oxidoreductase [Rhodospirillaceae bacterium]MBT5457315.1 NAD(P)-dependent oxidoreductase [Rhodospirillaceae bacterium]
MLKFVSVDRETPEKRPAEERRLDFDEIYRRFNDPQAEEQASRCSQCGIPFCQVHCPLHNNIPDWLMLTAEDRLEEAYELASSTNNFPEICGRICPQDRLCEGNCVIEQAGHGTVTIGAVESYITEAAFTNGWIQPPKPARELEQSVGIIGGGPGGMAAAEVLRRKGYQVHIYDRYDRIGGLLVYGIPSFKLEKEIVKRRVDLLEAAGVEMHRNVDIGGDVTFQSIRAKHDAVLIATGVYKARDIQVPGVGLGNIIPALDFLIASNRKGLGDSVPGFEDGSQNAADKRVVVLGAGDTAMDCVRTAVRQGAQSVTCLYRRDKANMPGSRREVQYAEEEGVQFALLAQPEAFLGDDIVSAVRTGRIHLGVADASGRQTPEIIDGSSFNVEADLVIKALGFDPEDMPSLFGVPELGVTRWGTIKINFRTKMTNLDGVFAAGDIVRGASLVVWGIRDGRDAATSIEQYLRARAPAAAASKAAVA